METPVTIYQSTKRNITEHIKFSARSQYVVLQNVHNLNNVELLNIEYRRKLCSVVRKAECRSTLEYLTTVSQVQALLRTAIILNSVR